MGFIVVVLLIRLIINVVSNKTNKENKTATEENTMDVKHPAEFLLR